MIEEIIKIDCDVCFDILTFITYSFYFHGKNDIAKQLALSL